MRLPPSFYSRFRAMLSLPAHCRLSACDRRQPRLTGGTSRLSIRLRTPVLPSISSSLSSSTAHTCADHERLAFLPLRTRAPRQNAHARGSLGLWKLMQVTEWVGLITARADRCPVLITLARAAFIALYTHPPTVVGNQKGVC